LPRLASSPLAEARVYQLLSDPEVSQRHIARRCGVSQSRVSKRLALLRLLERAHAYLDHNQLTLDGASMLAGLPAERQVFHG